ncbi:MAG TPA: hypothetical protein VLX92_17515 [Kofleriaceae bacterium]|nr:hypothetical protein [Kofleriaceae bacterium]
MTRAALVLALVAGCTDEHYLVVTVDARPAVHDATSLAVTLSNGEASRMQSVTLGSHTFPLTFSVSTPNRTGELDLTIEADDAGQTAVGLGSASTTIGTAKLDLMLEATDFVVNTDFAMDQFLSENSEANGLQLAVDSNGTWTVGFRDNCNQTNSCNIYGRRFDPRGVAQNTEAAAGTNAFLVTTDETQEFSTPAVTAAGSNTLVMWDADDPTDTNGTLASVACRALDAQGNASASQNALSTDDASSVTVTPLPNGNFAVSWEIFTPQDEIHTIIAKPDCTPVNTSPVKVSTTVGTTLGPGGSHVAANGTGVLYAWVTDGDAYVRAGNDTAGLTGTTDIKLLAHSADYEVRAVRLAPLGSGYALVVRWGNPGFSGPGKIELFQLTATGALAVPQPTLITDQSQGDFVSGSQAPGIALRASDGAMLVVWHACDASGSTGSCDVFGQMIRPDGSLSGTSFPLATTTMEDQTAPAAVALPDGSFAAAWNDSSLTPPDTSGLAVRARIIYPAYSASGG